MFQVVVSLSFGKLDVNLDKVLGKSVSGVHFFKIMLCTFLLAFLVTDPQVFMSFQLFKLFMT